MAIRITIVTLFPKMIEGFITDSIIKRAQEKGLVEVKIVNLRDFARDSYGSVDERPYGGGAGMVLCVDVLKKALSSLQSTNAHTILTSARGAVFNQKKALELSKLQEIVIFAGHYEGFDERFSDYIDEEISLGDYILTGGELTAATICDAVVRLLPGVLKKENATTEESFSSVSINQLIETVGSHPKLIELQKKELLKCSCWNTLNTRAPKSLMEKKYPKYCFPVTLKKSRHGSSNRHLSSPFFAAQIFLSNI